MTECMVNTACMLVKTAVVSPHTNATLIPGTYYSPGDPVSCQIS